MAVRYVNQVPNDMQSTHTTDAIHWSIAIHVFGTPGLTSIFYDLMTENL